MESATAQLNTYRQSPRKVRLLADLIRGQKVSQAITTLRFAGKRAAGPIIKLIESAAANAKNKGLNVESLVVDTISVNNGQILYRSMPMSRGRAFRIHKRTSHISVSLSERASKAKAERANAGKSEKPRREIEAVEKVKKDSPRAKIK